MTVKAYLEQINRFDKIIQHKLAEIYKLKVLASGISSTVDDDVRVQKSSNQDKMGTIVAKYVDLESEVEALVDSYTGKRKRIVGQIESIENTSMYEVLTMKYVEGKTIDEIASQLNYSRMQVNRIHGNALAEFDKKYHDFYA